MENLTNKQLNIIIAGCIALMMAHQVWSYSL